MTKWTKHDGTIQCPVDKDMLIEVETWSARGNTIAKAKDLNWLAVKFYREADSVDVARKQIKDELQPPAKTYTVVSGGEMQGVDGYQSACQRATDMYKKGEEPTIVIRYSKPSSGMTLD